MRLIFPGTGGYHPNERRQTASLLLPDIGVALDAGTGFFRVPPLLSTQTLDVFLTHAHLDHICGLTYILVPLMKGDLQRVRVFGQPNTIRAVRDHLFSEAIFPVQPPFEWCELAEASAVTLPDGGQLTWQALDHPGGSTGFRIDWPARSLAYITDTTAPGNYLEFIRGVDVLIHECYFPDDAAEWAQKTGHSAGTTVAQLARDADVGRLLLVHVDPQRTDDDPIGLADLQRIFPRTELPEDMSEITF